MSTQVAGRSGGRLRPVSAHPEDPSSAYPAAVGESARPVSARTRTGEQHSNGENHSTATEFLAAAGTTWADLAALDARSRRIVDAARDCFAEVGFEETTMVRIAELAGVGVATVYRRFGTKSALVRYALMAESQRVGLIMAEAVRRSAGPVSALAEMFAAFVSEARAPRLLTRSLRVSSAAGELTSFLTGDEFIEQGRALVARFLSHWQRRGELGDFDTDVVAELFVRLTMSFISNPRGVLPLDDAAAARQFARRFLAPLLFPHPGGR
ncbi:putative transcriptional regulator [Nocardia farcinica IFM 10152]|uniref:Putative transcriptional regulator n=1 Tax=Nocardia farcinica (strain IFM 10152) TaxID=247156 RepID=Q5YVH6_NOCFA|nr:putative transcriptional regulator [Nocardia farcinica IFM 10152]